MEILVNLDVMMAKRKISAGELAERVGITPANLSILKNNKGGFCRRQAVPLVRNLMRPVRRSRQYHTRGNRNGWRNGTCGVVRHKPQGKPVEIWR